ncbi:hypothetical protein BH11MYX3_BH11MYX3_41740 [soil metagenome]
METKSQIRVIGAAVTGARHLRTARNGQDAAATWAGEGAGAVVVCDGCGSGASSEVGARLGAQLVIAALARRIEGGGLPTDPALWEGMRVEVVARIAELGAAMGGELAQRIHEHFLFTVVAAAVAGEDAAVWVIGDGAYAIGTRIRELGPFPDNQPPYLAYDLLGMAQPAHHEAVPATGAATIMVATDGVAELGLDAIAPERCLAHPDALRRRLTLLARGTETIEWDARRVLRTAAPLQDDGAVAILAWCGRPS